jgi:hypothetical protein
VHPRVLKTFGFSNVEKLPGEIHFWWLFTEHIKETVLLMWLIFFLFSGRINNGLLGFYLRV